MALTAVVRVAGISSWANSSGDQQAEKVRLYFKDEDNRLRIYDEEGKHPTPIELELVSQEDWGFFDLGGEYRLTIEKVRTKRKTLDENEVNKVHELGIVDTEWPINRIVPADSETKITAVYSDGVREFVPTEEEGNAGTEE